MDETAHAAFSLALDAWIKPRLSPSEVQRVTDAQRAASDELRRECERAWDPALGAVLGLPDAATACALHAALERSLWSEHGLAV